MSKESKNEKNKKHFFKDFKAELKKVVWPTSKQIVNNTTAVITIIVITALIVFVLDLVFDKVSIFGINRLSEGLQKQQTINETINTSTLNEVEVTTTQEGTTLTETNTDNNAE